METNKLIRSKAELMFVVVLGLVAVGFTLVALVPEWRESARVKIRPDKREIVSMVTADILNNGSQFKVVKIKTNNSIFVEVYDTPNKDGLAPLLEKIELKNSRDAYFYFNKNTTRLALQDIDGDNRPEILVPSFDSDLIAHIQIFRISPETHKVELVSN